MYLEKENMHIPDVANSKSFFSSALVMFKPGLCSNNKLTARSIVFLSGLLVNKLQTSQEIKNLLVAVTFFISSQNVNECFVQ